MSTLTETETTPRAWIGCLGCYNNGDLVGKWLDAEEAADLEASGLTDAANVCVTCGAEEFWVMDHENLRGNRGEMGVSEFIERAALSAAISDHDNADALEAWLDNQHLNGKADDVAQFDDFFLGSYDSVEEYAEQMLEDCGALAEVPEMLRYYFDFEKYARDLEMNGDVSSIEHAGGVYLFRNC